MTARELAARFHGATFDSTEHATHYLESLFDAARAEGKAEGAKAAEKLREYASELAAMAEVCDDFTSGEDYAVVYLVKEAVAALVPKAEATASEPTLPTPIVDMRRAANWKPPASGARCFAAIGASETCMYCEKHVSRHYGSYGMNEYRCDPMPDPVEPVDLDKSHGLDEATLREILCYVGDDRMPKLVRTHLPELISRARDADRLDGETLRWRDSHRVLTDRAEKAERERDNLQRVVNERSEADANALVTILAPMAPLLERAEKAERSAKFWKQRGEGYMSDVAMLNERIGLTLAERDELAEALHKLVGSIDTMTNPQVSIRVNVATRDARAALAKLGGAT